MFAGCNLQPRVVRELPTFALEFGVVSARGICWDGRRGELNNVPFTGQMMSNCEEELGQEG